MFHRFFRSAPVLLALVFGPASTLESHAADIPDNKPAIVLSALRSGHQRPLIAVLAHPRGTEAIQLLVPYGILSRSGQADVEVVSSTKGPLPLRPALTLGSETTLDTFDQQHGEGADIVVVPESSGEGDSDAACESWLQEQAHKGALMVSISEGVQNLAHAGLLEGHRALGHWSTLAQRQEQWPATQWVTGLRYVQDGNVVSTAGAASAVPVSLALVEAIAGHEKAVALAADLGVTEWSPQHETQIFQRSATYLFGAWSGLLSRHETVAYTVDDGVDEIALGLALEPWSHTHRTKIAVQTDKPAVRSRSGLMLEAAGQKDLHYDHISSLAAGPSAHQLKQTLDDIGARYGPRSLQVIGAELEMDLSRTDIN